jgi:hypothetical protein
MPHLERVPRGPDHCYGAGIKETAEGFIHGFPLRRHHTFSRGRRSIKRKAFTLNNFPEHVTFYPDSD